MKTLVFCARLVRAPPANVCFVCQCRLLSVSVNLTLKTINLQTVRHHELPDCYDFHIMVGDKRTTELVF